MQRETHLNDQLQEMQETISMIVQFGGIPKEEKIQFKEMIRELSHLWDALIEVNRQIREVKASSEKQRCPICNDLNCSLCIPF